MGASFAGTIDLMGADCAYVRAVARHWAWSRAGLPVADRVPMHDLGRAGSIADSSGRLVLGKSAGFRQGHANGEPTPGDDLWRETEAFLRHYPRSRGDGIAMTPWAKEQVEMRWIFAPLAVGWYVRPASGRWG